MIKNQNQAARYLAGVSSVCASAGPAKADRDARRWPRGRGPARTVVDRVSRRRRGDSVGRMARAEALHLPL